MPAPAPSATPWYGLADGVGVGASVGVGEAPLPDCGTQAAAARAATTRSATTRPPRIGDDGRGLSTG